MADNYDGSVELAVDLSPEKAEKTAKKLGKSIQNIFDSVSGQKLDSQFEKMLSNMSKGVSRSESLQKSLEKVANQRIPTEDYKAMQSILQKNEATLERLNERQYQMEVLGQTGSKAYKKLQEDIKQAEINIRQATADMEQMKADGEAFTINTEGIEAAKNALADSNNSLRMMIEAAAEYQQKQSDISQQHAQETNLWAEDMAKIMQINEQAGQIDPELGEILERMRVIRSELDALYERQAQLEAAGVGLGYEEYDRNLGKINELEQAYDRLNGRVEQYRETQMQGGEQSYTVWERFSQMLRQIGTDMLHPIQAIQRIRANTEDAGQTADNATNRFSRLHSILARLGGSVLRNLTARFRSAGRAASNFGNKLNFKNILAYAIGIRGLFGLFSKLRTAITSAVTDMAKLNGGMNQTNVAISALQSSLNFLKGSLAAAFTPILTYITPALTTFINQIANVINAIGMMIAKLTGAKSYFRATYKATNYGAASSSGSSGKTAQEKYEEALAKYKEKYDKQVAAVAAKNAKAQAKAEEQNAKAAEKYAKAQEKANRQLADFDDLNVLNIETLEELEEVEADVYEDPEWDPPTLEDYLDASGGGGSDDPFGLEEVALDGFEWDWDAIKAKAEELGRSFADSLNDFFADEAMAAAIGQTIAEFLNTALHAAYGFIDELNWRQMGRWLGTLVREGIETFEWDLLGTTIGEFLNGLANTVIGFFETYPAGTLGSSMATMFNNGIAAIDAVALGEAVADILKAPFIELSAFLTETNFKEAGRKIGIFFSEMLTNTSVNGQSLGWTIGKFLADAVNAGIDLLLGANVSQAITSITMFFYDMFSAAISNVEWNDILELLVDIFVGIAESLVLVMGNALIDLKGWFDPFFDVSEAKEQFKSDMDDAFTSAGEDIKTFMGIMTEAQEGSNQFTSAIALMNEYMLGLPEGFDSWEQALLDIQEQYGYTNEDMDTLIGLMAAQNEEFASSSEILSGYTGNWAEYKATLEGTSTSIDTATSKQGDLSSAIDDVGTTAAETSGKVKNYVQIAGDNMETGVSNAQAYESDTVEALQGITDAGDDVVVSFETLETQLNSELEALTTAIDTWYQGMIETYFGYDAWYLMLQENVLLAFNDFMTVDFFTAWDTNMTSWWDEHVKVWFAQEKWVTDIFTPWETMRNTRWTALMTWWDTSITSWWNDKVVPWFKEEKWKQQFMHVYNKANEVGAKTRDAISGFAGETQEAVVAACDAMKTAIQEIIDMLNEAISLADSIEVGGGSGGSSGGSSTRSSGGTSSGGRSSRSFMPMLDVMHFEDNLGMSAFRFPELARGAVIPPNNKFLAVLGDQKSGKNIETPLNTMLQAFRTVMDEYGGNRGPSNATMEVDGETFARLILPYVMDEMRRQGYNTEIIEGA